MRITMTLLMLLVLFLPNASAQASTQWNLPEGAVARLGKGYLRQVQYSPAGARLAVLSSIGICWLYDATTYREVTLLAGRTDTVLSVAFSPDGKVLASGGKDRTVRLWDAKKGKLKRTLTEHTGVVLSVGFSPDGRILASGSDDGTVLLWKITD